MRLAPSKTNTKLDSSLHANNLSCLPPQVGLSLPKLTPHEENAFLQEGAQAAEGLYDACGNRQPWQCLTVCALAARSQTLWWMHSLERGRWGHLHQPQRTGSQFRLYASALSNRCSKASKQYSCFMLLSSPSITTPLPAYPTTPMQAW